MDRYGLIGYPLGHSFSAAFFNEKFCREGIDAQYTNHAVPDPAQLSQVLSADNDAKGFNVTIPYKTEIIPLLDTIDPIAEEIGAVNTIKACRRPDGATTLSGFNTDAPAFARTLAPLLPPEPLKALVLGTGGASKAVCYALKALGIPYAMVSRTPHDGQLGYGSLTPPDIASRLLIVNTTPLGMHPHVDQAPDIPYEAITPRHICYDLIYNPTQTEFMRRASLRGATVKNGLDMLHLQALLAWEIWQRPCC